MRLKTIFLSLGLGLALLPASYSQTNGAFQLVIQDRNSNVTAIPNAATLTLTADALKQSVGLTLIATYRGSSTASVSAPVMFGSTQFTSAASSGNSVLNPGDTFSVTINFTPTTTTQATAQITIPYSESPAGGSHNTPGSSGTIVLSLVGTTPQFVVTYFLQPDQNILPLADGDTLNFAPTPVSTTAVAGIVIQNQGSGPGPINAVKVTGAGFQVQGVPLLPGSVNPTSVLQFVIRYTPTQAKADQGTLQVTFPDRTVTVTLAGNGTAPTFTYQLLQNGQATDITPNQAIAIPGVSVGSTSAFSITVQNSGNGTGIISAAGLSGTGFQLTDAPAFPQTLTQGAFITFNFIFTASQVGDFKAHLRIGNDTFDLTSQGTGSQLQYSYSTAAGSTTTLPGNGTLVFSPVQIGQNANTVFSIQNTGTVPATVISISIAEPKSSYALTALPNFPMTLAPNATANFTIVFTPSGTGLNSATLRIDTQTFILAGSGNPPPALPAYQFVGASGVQDPLQQPAIGLTLAAPYSVPLTGTLTMVVNPDRFSPDPAVQFSTGGRTVPFTIPANTTQAVFPNSTTTIKLQTGSVSGSISINPSFATPTGFDLTPANPTPVQFTVLPAAPQLLNVQVMASNANGFTLQVTGITTSMTLTELDYAFASAPAYNLAASKVAVDVSAQVAAWFQSGQSQSFGGQFTIAIPFNLASNAAAPAAPPLSAVQSVTVSAKNDKGTSNTVTTQIN